MKKVIVIGGGIAGLSAAAVLAKEGFRVTLLEKNDSLGGRARKFSTENGFTFDMGPSWYWMPGVFEQFYQQFGHSTSDFYELKRLDPSYRIFWEDDSYDDIPIELETLKLWFEKLERGSAQKLEKFLNEAQYKYEVGMNEMVYKPSLRLSEFVDFRIVKSFFKLHLLTAFSKLIRKSFDHPKILSLLEFPILFLGAKPSETPALYSLMNYADLVLGTWYPMGGIHKVVEAFEQIALEQGVEIKTSAAVDRILIEKNTIVGVETQNEKLDCDILVSGADYHHTEKLLGEHSNYSDVYWEKRVLTPSCLIFYLGTSKKIKNLQHHNLFFDESFENHAASIYGTKEWPEKPLFYVCAPSKTDDSVAPAGMENLFILVPIAPDLKESKELEEHYYDLLLERLEKHTQENIRDFVVYKRHYCIEDFKLDYNAFKGNAYGLANTLRQTAFLKPKIKHKKIANCYFTGQLTIPGPGLPPAVISGQVVAKQIIKSNLD